LVAQLKKEKGEFAMILIIRQAGDAMIETGLIYYGKEWETVYLAMLKMLNQLQKNITFAEILEGYHDCPVQNKEYTDPEDPEAEAICKAALDLTWPNNPDSEDASPIPEREIDPVDRMLEWLETLPATNLQATVQFGNDVMEFNKTNLFDLAGFGRCADDRFAGEIIISRTETNGKQTIAGLLL